MQTILNHTPRRRQLNEIIETKISFRPFIAYLEKIIKVEKTIKARYYEYILQQFYDEPATFSNVAVVDIKNYSKFIELIYAVLTPLTANEEECLWAIADPSAKDVLYSTSTFLRLTNNWKKVEQATELMEKKPAELETLNTNFVYNIILNKFYHLTSNSLRPIIYSCTDQQTGLMKYYKVLTDTRFVEVLSKNALPSIDFETFNVWEADGVLNKVLLDVMPLSNFYLEGLAVITLEDITAEYAINLIKEILLENSPDQELLFDKVKAALKILGGNKDAEFGMLPLLFVNNKLVFDEVECGRSVLMKAARECGDGMENIHEKEQSYLKDPTIKIYPFINWELRQENRYLDYLFQVGVEAYAVLPVYYNQQIVGVLEVYAHQEMLRFETLIAKLNSALPLVAQLLRSCIDQFDQKIDNVIMQKFTPLQPAVQWKFNEVALQYLRLSHFGKENIAIGKITFKKVYPLFAAVDIRNSTIERNQALNEDAGNLLNLLDNGRIQVTPLLSGEALAIVQKRFLAWQQKIEGFLKVNDSALLNAYLLRDVLSYLKSLVIDHPATARILNKLIKIIENDEDEISRNRRLLEQSIQGINSVLNRFYEQERKKLEAIYPCYFESFRTDGVEYDIYAGQSIDPAREFTQSHLEAFRLWQLESMCRIVRLTKLLETSIPKALRTTQLIYVNPHFIDVSFRNDERRFDVEGAYNIRYQIIKKRIDKVLIKNTSERLTQPGKIAIVYFKEENLDEYRAYIKTCQDTGYLHDDVEMLDLEDLQGVSGLRAIRVSVLYS
jgi:hypothetical protein